MMSDSSSTDVSLVIATRNRAATLPMALASLLRLESRHRADIVIVDNGSSDNTPALLAEFARQSKIPVQIVSFTTPGLGRARNAGWKPARGRIIAFTDDDCYPAPSFIDDALEAMSNSRMGYVGGRIMLHDPTDVRATIREDMHPEHIPAHSIVAAGCIQGANFIIRREALESVGGFDDNLGAGTPFPCEDVDLVQRLSTAGWDGGYDPRPMVAHHHRRKGQEALRSLMRSYDFGRGAHYAKCMLVRGLRWRILLLWMQTALSHSPMRTVRELRAAGRYLWRRATQQLDPTPVSRPR